MCSIVLQQTKIQTLKQVDMNECESLELQLGGLHHIILFMFEQWLKKFIVKKTPIYVKLGTIYICERD